MFRGFTTINFFVDDIRAATRWYADLLGIEPYFIRPSAEEPAYVEFRMGRQRGRVGAVRQQLPAVRSLRCRAGGRRDALAC
jgi:catechol 2,3-dioxygenase-like lactoylglutathione lyase family enzyme